MKFLILLLAASVIILLFSCEKSTDAVQTPPTVAEYIHSKLAGTWEISGGNNGELWRFYHSTDIDTSLWEYYETNDTNPNERIYRKLDSIILIDRYNSNKSEWGNYKAYYVGYCNDDSLNFGWGKFQNSKLNFVSSKQWIGTFDEYFGYTLTGRLVE